MITGMLGKAKGQILHVAACLQMFFDDSATTNEEMDDETEQSMNMEIEQVEELPTLINADAIAAAINFVQVCCQHTLYITGRHLLADEVNKYKYTEGTVYDVYTCITSIVTLKSCTYHTYCNNTVCISGNTEVCTFLQANIDQKPAP